MDDDLGHDLRLRHRQRVRGASHLDGFEGVCAGGHEVVRFERDVAVEFREHEPGRRGLPGRLACSTVQCLGVERTLTGCIQAGLAIGDVVGELLLVALLRDAEVADTGMSVFDWITRERVNQAKALLETTEYRVSEIAAMVGMGSSESLRRNFDKLIGTTASAYRLAFRPDTARRTGAVA